MSIERFVDGLLGVAARNALIAAFPDSQEELDAVVVLAQYNLIHADRQLSPRCTTAILERLNGLYR